MLCYSCVISDNKYDLPIILRYFLIPSTYFLQKRFHIAIVDGVHTHRLMAIPAPNIENRCINTTLTLGLDAMEQLGNGPSVLVPLRMVTLASHLWKRMKY